jgi:putative nucleic acid binding protein
MLKKREIFQGGIILLILVVLCAYYFYNKPRGSAADENTSASIIADSLYIQYQQDEHAADLKYLGKVIEVKGVFSELSNNGGLKILMLSPQKTGGGISCQMFAKNNNSFAIPKKGDTIIIKGKCTGFLMDVDLVDCVVK